MAYPDPKIVTVAAPTNTVNTTRLAARRSARSTTPTEPYVVILSGGQQEARRRGTAQSRLKTPLSPGDHDGSQQPTRPLRPKPRHPRRGHSVPRPRLLARLGEGSCV